MLLISFLFSLTSAERSFARDDFCDGFLLEDKDKNAIALRPRKSSARLIDTFAFGNAYEGEELLLRLNEMGEEVSEFHIVEGDRDFTGTTKPYTFDELLNSGRLGAWQDKITYHRAKIPKGVKGYKLQDAQRQAMRSQMHPYRGYDQSDILLEGDLDEIVSQKALQALKHCEPVTGAWNTHIHMANFYYSVAWTNGDWGLPTTAAFFSEVQDSPTAPTASAAFFETGSVWTRPNMLSTMDGSVLGWHFGWILNGSAGLAHKIFIHVEGFPDWAKGFRNEAALATFLETSFYANPDHYDPQIYPSKLGKTDLPQALVSHPEEFPNILRDVKW